MNVAAIIDKNYVSVSILEDTRQIREWLRECSYLAVVDEDLQTVGIITRDDVIKKSHYQLIDCAFTKPCARPDQSLNDAIKMMRKSRKSFLPVYNGSNFVGVISLHTIQIYLSQQIPLSVYAQV
jgi:CBS domain-containing protein